MIREAGDMFQVRNIRDRDITLIATTNSYIRRDGAVVMGRGAAKRMASLYPWIPKRFGERITHLGFYGYLEIDGLGAFQVKKHFKDNAEIELIAYSCGMLSGWAYRHPETEYHMNYPGIGNGRLKPEQVEKYILMLPDNVHVWTFA